MNENKLPKGFRRRKNGTLEHRFVVDGVRCSVYGQSIEECIKKEEEIRNRASRPADAYSTMSDYFRYWIRIRIGTVRSSTINTQRAQLITIGRIRTGRKTFGDLKLCELNTQDMRLLQAALAERFSTNTVNQYMTLVKSVLKTAVQEQRIDHNPCEGMRKLLRTEAEARNTIHRALTLDETERFFMAAQNSRYYNLYRFLLNTGCRCGEAAAVAEGDIENDILYISKTITKTDGGALSLGRFPKTSSGKRSIPLTAAAKDALNRELSYDNTVYGSSASVENCIFRSPTGNYLSSSSVDAELRRICMEAGIPTFTTHAFRGTFATRAIEAGMNPKTLQEILGHSDFSLTMNLYCHCMEETKLREMKLLEDSGICS